MYDNHCMFWSKTDLVRRRMAFSLPFGKSLWVSGLAEESCILVFCVQSAVIIVNLLLWDYTTLNKHTFLKVNYSVDSETIPINFSFSVTLKPSVLYCTSNASFYSVILKHHILVIHLQNKGPLSYSDIPYFNIFYYIISKHIC